MIFFFFEKNEHRDMQKPLMPLLVILVLDLI